MTGIIARVLPRAVAGAAWRSRWSSELSSVSAAWDGMDVLLPIGRFGGLVWMVAVGATLPATRRDLRARRGEVRAADEESGYSALRSFTTRAGTPTATQ